MGHKVHPNGFRLGVVRGWQSRWYAERGYKDILAEDILIRSTVNKELANAAVSKIEIERTAADQVLVKVHTAKPGIVIGKSGEKVERLRALLEAKTRKRRIRMDIIEIRQPELDAILVSRSIAEQLEKRISFRRAMKQAVQKSMRANAKGIKIIVGGRLGGAEIARSEKEVEGSVPLQTLRADIDYGQAEAHTTFGVIGIKVWIYRGDILPMRRRETSDQLIEAIGPVSQLQREERRGGERGDRRPRGERQPAERRGGERPVGERGPRSPRPPGDRPQGERPQGERGPRPPRPQGERVPRPPRPQGERVPRPPRQPRPQAPTSSEGSVQAPQAPQESQAPQSSAPESGTTTQSE